MASLTERLRVRPGRLVIAAAMGMLAVTGLVWLATFGDGGDQAANARSIEVRPAPFTLYAHFTGHIIPGDQAEIAAPFDGTVRQVHFSFGDQVARDDLLITFDPADVARARAEAEAAWLRAEDAMDRIESWSEGAEMRRARRALESADTDLRDAERRLEETAALFERGLVSRNELEGLVQQERSRRRAFVQAQEELAETRRRGEGTERRIAYLEREMARAQMQTVDDGAVTEIRAPSYGVIVRPSTGREADETGTVSLRVSRGQVLAVIASPDGLAVQFHLDEGDLGIVSPGQPVSVSGPGFDGAQLSGRISGVSGQAERGGRDAMARFAAHIRLDPLEPDAAERVRIGMTAHIRVITYHSEAALVIPPEAVQGGSGGAWVMVRDDAHNAAERRDIQIGRVGPAGVEVLAGLEPGHVVIW
ncbi:HlyD family efflux transporter periplasmic adaptor subunit [Alkalicaulis satelles]|uniref:HlyD family efflux transporter periplasmic adaptor subunit n=1 Tax=Alkalicaulis satelles TaxID=2609175 RepID=A0A5M6ZEV6_9PROT|nr:HlyD family efflux transporter periplasmic adaptor subunit [Alkalicaulis satelles]KAA5802287.1 HlyD family efflux transporter periplasmic adaptor subunit [Alkalicaulis satelles]